MLSRILIALLETSEVNLKEQKLLISFYWKLGGVLIMWPNEENVVDTSKTCSLLVCIVWQLNLSAMYKQKMPG